MGLRWIAVLGVVLAACDPGLEIRFKEKLAVGTTKRMEVSGSCIGMNCTGIDITEIVEVVIEKPNVLGAMVIDADTFTLTAHTVGESLATVVAVDVDRELHKEELDVSTFLIDRVDFAPKSCEHRPELAAPKTYVPPDQVLDFTWTLFGTNSVELEGDVAFDAPGLTQTRIDQETREVAFRMPATAGVYPLTSTVWPNEPVHTIEVYTASAIDGLDVDVVFGSTTVSGSVPVDVRPMIGGTAPCEEDVERTLRVITPTLCSLSNTLQVDMATTREVRWSIYGRAAGTCQVEVTLTGTTLMGIAQVEIMAGAP